MAEIEGKTFAELQAAFETHTGISGEIDSAELAIWLNEAQYDLATYFELPDMPAPFTGASGNQISDLPPILHDLMPLWATSRYWDRESEGDAEESGHGTKWMGYYLRSREQCKNLLHLKGPKPEQWVVI